MRVWRGCVCVVAAVVLTGSGLVAQGGSFDPPFNHEDIAPHAIGQPGWDRARNDPVSSACPPATPPAWIRAMHMSLIPTPPLQGRVLVWDGNEGANPDGYQFYSIIDPTLPNGNGNKFWNFELSVPQHRGYTPDFGCAGHTWTKDGKLFMAGGTANALPPDGIVGTKFAYEFDATQAPGTYWVQRDDLQEERWYPTCKLAWHHQQGERILAAGGRATADDYEAFDPALVQWKTWGAPQTQRLFRGPSHLGQFGLWAYPWLYQLSNGDMFRAGFAQEGAVVYHFDGPSAGDATWTARHKDVVFRSYGCSFLHPNIDANHVDAVVGLGGQGFNLAILKSVAIAKASLANSGSFPAGHDWTPLDDMRLARFFANAVVLPDGSVVVFGGKDGPNAHLQAERFAGGQWRLDAIESLSFRDYHSTAVLLPDGSVLVGGGDSRCWDYVIYRPPYLNSGSPRPTFVPGPPQFNPAGYNSQLTVQYSVAAGTTISKVVLMRPGSTTHHIDFDQRYVQLPFILVAPLEGQTEKYLTFTTPVAPPGPANPPNSNAAPPGWYMLFLVSSAGVPSVAGWIKLQ
jgi:hypothetical protein